MIDILSEMAKFTYTSKYARYDEKKKRRETWTETVSRVEKMHLKKFAHLSEDDKSEIKWAFDLVRDKIVVPSMRSMQFAGKAIESHNAKLYNCAVIHITCQRSFAEFMYLLLNGCGVGFSVQKQFIDRLPNLVTAKDKNGTVLTYVIEDTIEGWSDSIEALVSCYFKNTAFTGRKIVFDYSKIRPEGAKLKTSGGKAPGYKGLKAAHLKIKKLLDSTIEDKDQSRLYPINVYDILMYCSDAVLSGGVRRSATLCLFDKDDTQMLEAKTGEWFKDNPQRARSNNSCLINRNTITKKEFKEIIEHTKNFGEPGFIFCDDDKSGFIVNPCAEISFIPITKDGRSGVQFCNLTEINGKKVDSLAKFKEAAKAAAIIGTLQASYTTFPYLSNAAKELTEDEALLGVSITGMMENPLILLDEDNQQICARITITTNKKWAKILGINQAARITCNKPSGTASIVLESSCSGIHPSHSRNFLRRIQMNKHDNVYQWFKQINPEACEESVWSANKTDDVVTFPIQVSEKTLLKQDLSAIQHLDIIKNTQKNWVAVGSTSANKKNIHHSISCTILVKDTEWSNVSDYLYENRHDFTAVSLLADNGDKVYQQAPFESMVSEEDLVKFNKLKESFKAVDYTKMFEEDDDTNLQQEMSCVGGVCLV